MNTLALIALTGWQLLLFKIAIVCIVFWGATRLVKWTGWMIPEPVWIIAICLFSILLIYWLFELFNALV